MVTLVNKGQSVTKGSCVCAGPPLALLSGVGSTVELRHKAQSLHAAAAEGHGLGFSGELTLIRSHNLQHPSLVHLFLIKHVEDHLVLVILMTTCNTQSETGVFLHVKHV